MSVNVYSAGEVADLFRAVKFFTPDLASLDTFTAMHAATFAAYTISYGEVPEGVQVFSNRLDHPTLGHGRLLDREAAGHVLRMLHYNWMTNGGTDCLPERYRASVNLLTEAYGLKLWYPEADPLSK